MIFPLHTLYGVCIYIYILGIINIDSPEGSKAANHAVLGFVLG